jgi:hypothetical protein
MKLLNELKMNDYNKKWLVFLIKLRNLNFLTFCLVAGLLAITGSLFLVVIALLVEVDIDAQLVDYIPDIEFSLKVFWEICIMGPIVETAILSALLLVLFKSKLTLFQCCIISALFFGGVHGILAPIKFFTASWTFFIFSISFCLWKKFGYRKSFLAAALPHVILNSITYFLIFVEGVLM